MKETERTGHRLRLVPVISVCSVILLLDCPILVVIDEIVPESVLAGAASRAKEGTGSAGDGGRRQGPRKRQATTSGVSRAGATAMVAAPASRPSPRRPDRRAQILRRNHHLRPSTTPGAAIGVEAAIAADSPGRFRVAGAGGAEGRRQDRQGTGPSRAANISHRLSTRFHINMVMVIVRRHLLSNDDRRETCRKEGLSEVRRALPAGANEAGGRDRGGDAMGGRTEKEEKCPLIAAAAASHPARVSRPGT